MKKKRRKSDAEFVLSREDCTDIMLAAYSLKEATDTNPEAVKELAELARELDYIDWDYRKCKAKLVCSVPEVSARTLHVLSRVLLAINSGADANRIFRRHLKTKPNYSYLHEGMAEVYYKRWAKDGPSTGDAAALQAVRDSVSFMDLGSDESIRRYVRKYRNSIIRELLADAEYLYGNLDDFMRDPETDQRFLLLRLKETPTLEQIRALIQYLKKKSPR